MISLKNKEKSLLTLNNGHIISGYIIDRRVSKDEMPEYYHKYEIRSSDDNQKKYATLEKQVIVNFCCTFISKTEVNLGIDDKKYKEIKEINLGDIIE